MRSIDNRPNWAISFDDGDRPTVKTDKTEFFPSHSEVVREQALVEGSYVLFGSRRPKSRRT